MFAIAQFWAGAFWALGIITVFLSVLYGFIDFMYGLLAEDSRTYDIYVGIACMAFGIILGVGLNAVGAPPVF